MATAARGVGDLWEMEIWWTVDCGVRWGRCDGDGVVVEDDGRIGEYGGGEVDDSEWER